MNLTNCPKCGQFCGQITAYGNEHQGITKIMGTCRTHGRIELTESELGYDDFIFCNYEEKVKGVRDERKT